MSMHHRIGENLNVITSLPIEDVEGNPVILPGMPITEFVDFGNHETLDDEYDGAPEPLTDIELPFLGQ